MTTLVRAIIAGLLFAAQAVPAWALEEADYAALNQAVAATVIVPGYDRLAVASSDLNEAGQAFCAAPDAAGLERLRAAFVTTIQSWAVVQQVRFGPVSLFMRTFRIQFWPDKRGRTGPHLSAILAASDPAALAPDRFGRGSVATQGLPALERLLFNGPETLSGFSGGGSSGAGFSADGFRCGLLQAITGNVAGMAREILAAWTTDEPSFLGTIAAPGEGNPFFLTYQEVTAELFGDFATLFQAMLDLKLGAVLGGDIGAARPKRAEAWRSGQSLPILIANLESLHAVHDRGFARHVRDPEIRNAISDAFTEARDAAAAIDGPLARAVMDPERRPLVEAFHAKLRALQRLSVPALVGALDLPVGFNSLDGD